MSRPAWMSDMQFLSSMTPEQLEELAAYIKKMMKQQKSGTGASEKQQQKSPTLHSIPDFVLETMGMDAEQVSTVMALIGGPEQANVEWWLGADGKSVYGYCENIDDGRGVTVGLAGFVSKWGELQRVFANYGADISAAGDPGECKPRKNCKLCDWVRARGEDQRWIDAQWKAYRDNYMQYVPKFVPKKFADNALIKGLLLDTAMNSGIGSEGNAWGMDKLAKTAKGSTPLEWLNNFCDLRYDHFASGNPESSRKGRLLTWRTLAADGKWDLRGVDPCKYAFCYGKKLGEGCKGCGKK